MIFIVVFVIICFLPNTEDLGFFWYLALLGLVITLNLYIYVALCYEWYLANKRIQLIFYYIWDFNSFNISLKYGSSERRLTFL